MDEKTVQLMLSSLLICLVSKGEFIEFEEDAPPEKVIRLEDVVQIIDTFKKEYGE